MRKLILLMSFLGCCYNAIPQVSPKAPVKTSAPAANRAKPNLTAQSSKAIRSATSMPSSWFRSDMDKTKVIPVDGWLSNGLEVLLVNDDNPGYREQINHAAKSLVFYPDLSEGELVAHYVTPMERGHDRNSVGFPVQKVNMNEPVMRKNITWRLESWMDGTFSLFSLRYRAYLALGQDPSTGKVTGLMIDSGRVTDPMKIKFALYRTGRTVNTPIAFYHPGTKTFLTVEGNPSFNTYRSDEFTALTNRMQKIPVKFIGASTGMNWDMGDVFGMRNSIRFHSPGLSADMDGDGHKALDCNGDDCDDNDANRFPGNPEKADNTGHDEDCICNYELVDKDGDGFYDINSYNICEGGRIEKGTDCDDNNPAIRPGAIVYISPSEAMLCGTGKITAGAGRHFIRQQNGTALEVPN